MGILLTLLGLGLLVLLLSWQPRSAKTWLIALGAYLLVAHQLTEWPIALSLIATALWLLALALSLLASVRLEYLVAPLIGRLGRHLPQDGIQTSLEEDSSWEAELARGLPNWGRLRGVHSVELSPAEQSLLDGPLRELCRRWQQSMPDAQQARQELAALNLLYWSSQSPVQERPLSATAFATAWRRISACPAAADLAAQLLDGGRLAAINAVERHGPGALRDALLPAIESGKADLAQALAAGPLPATVLRDEAIDGRPLRLALELDLQGIPYLPTASHLLLSIELKDPENLLERQGNGSCLLLLPLNTPGLSCARETMQAAAPSLGRCQGHCRLPLDQVLGSPRHWGQGQKQWADALIEAHSLGLPTLVAGALQAMLKEALAHHDSDNAALDALACHSYASLALSRQAAGQLDCGERRSLGAQLTAEAAQDDGLTGLRAAEQALGLAAWSEDSSLRHYRQLLPALQSSAHKPSAVMSTPAPWPSLQRALREESESATDIALRQCLSRLYLLGSHSFVDALSQARSAKGPRSASREDYQILAQLSTALALLRELQHWEQLLYGCDPEAMSGRLQALLRELYRSSIALKRFEEDGCVHSLLLRKLLREHTERSHALVQEAVQTLDHGLWRFKARCLLYPLGRPWPQPLAKNTAPSWLQQPGPARDSLLPDVL